MLREVYFKKTPISVLNKIERLITVLNGIEEINLLELCLPILKKIRDQGNTVLLSRYLICEFVITVFTRIFTSFVQFYQTRIFEIPG